VYSWVIEMDAGGVAARHRVASNTQPKPPEKQIPCFAAWDVKKLETSGRLPGHAMPSPLAPQSLPPLLLLLSATCAQI